MSWSWWTSWRILLPSGVVASPVPVQERLRAWLCENSLFGRHPYADSRVQLTEGWRTHSSGRGDVLSFRAPTAPGMALQCPGWQHNDGEDRTRLRWRRRRAPLVWCHDVVQCGRGVGVCTSLKCSAVLLRGVRRGGRTGVGGTASRSWHWPSRTVPRMTAHGGLAEQRRDVIPRRCQRAGVEGIRLLTRAPAACQSI
jgi:hypothetical protein